MAGQVEDDRGRHRTFDRGSGDLAVTLGCVPVTQAEQPTRDGDRQVEGGPLNQRTAVDVAAAPGPRRNRRMLAGFGGWDAEDTQKRREPDAMPELIGGCSGCDIELPEQPRRLDASQAKPSTELRFAGGSHRPTPRIR